MNKKIIKGYIFETTGCEHGPTLMLWKGKWNKDVYEKFKKRSWCDNQFTEDENYNSDKGPAKEIDFGIENGKQYKITIEEVK